MARNEVHIQIDTSELDGLLRKLSDRIGSDAMFQEVGNLVLNTTERAFELERSPDGTAWMPLKTSTVLEKTRRYGSAKKRLWAEGDMQGSLTMGADQSGAVVGLNAYTADGYPYPIVHQFGTNRAGRNGSVSIPARPFLPITSSGDLMPNVKEEIADVLKEMLLA